MTKIFIQGFIKYGMKVLSKNLLTAAVKMPKYIVRGYDVETILGAAKLYKMADAKTGEYTGEMVASVEKIKPFSVFYPPLSCRKSFKIQEIYVENRGLGCGTAFINIAKKESKRLGCNGRVFLVASRVYTPNKPPHLFYRKLGFTAKDKEKIKYFDECIKNGIPAAIEKTDNLPMYLPLKYNNIVKFFRKLFMLGL